MENEKPNYVNSGEQFANVSILQFTLREMHRVFSKPNFWIGYVAVVIVLVVSGPFYTAINLNFAERLAYWILISASSFALGLFTSLFLGALLQQKGVNRQVAITMAGFLAGIPIAGIVWLAGNLLFDFNPGDTRSELGVLVIQCAVISAIVALLFSLFATNSKAIGETRLQSEIPSSFLDRLPVSLGKDLISVQAQDHYLKVTTSKGSEMILMRMADACIELSDFNGLQVHRSWWIAASHVEAFEKTGGKAALKLSNGEKVPVSRGFMKAVKERIG